MLSSFSPKMQRVLLTVYKSVVANRALRSLLLIFHPETGSIVKFLCFAAAEISSGSRILDAGAGSMVYKSLFGLVTYEATDFYEVNKTYLKDEKLDFICDLSKIPQKQKTYDAIICTQVLEHVRNPQKVINEFYRILKEGGKLFLTAPQGWGLHDEPHHYFNFTRYGLRELFSNAGFKIKWIKERGGYFSYLSVRLQEMPLIFLRRTASPWGILALPLFLITAVTFFLIAPVFLFIFDRIFDPEKKYTLGYACYCMKE